MLPASQRAAPGRLGYPFLRTPFQVLSALPTPHPPGNPTVQIRDRDLPSDLPPGGDWAGKLLAGSQLVNGQEGVDLSPSQPMVRVKVTLGRYQTPLSRVNSNPRSNFAPFFQSGLLPTWCVLVAVAMIIFFSSEKIENSNTRTLGGGWHER